MPDVLRTETRRPRSVWEARDAGRFATAAICLGAFSGPFDTTIVAFSLPTLQHRFGASMAAVQWVSLGYLLAMVALLTLAGRSSGALGGRSLFVCGFVVVTVASAGCGLASTLVLIIAFRVVQAVGAAALLAATSTVTSRSIAPEERRPVVRARGVAQTIGLVAGPAVGGVLVGLWGWRSVFLMNVPVGVAGAVAGGYLLPRTRDHAAAGRLDWTRAALTAVFLASALLMVSGISGMALPAWGMVASAFVCTLSCIGLGVLPHRRAPGSATARWARTAAARAGAGHLALFALLALFAQICAVRGVRPAIAGVVAAAPLAGFATGSLARRGSAHVRGPAAAAFCVVAMGGLALAPANPAVSGALLAMAGAALGVLVTAYAVAGEPVPRRETTAGGGLSTVGPAIGITLGLATATLCTHIPGRHDSGPNGAKLTLAVLILTVSAITGTAFFTRPRVPPRPAEGGGTPPDARFLLANERTFLAWSRTALALVAAGLAIVQLLHPFPGIPWGRHLLGVLLIMLGAVVATVGYLELQRNRRALYRNEPLPPSVLPKVLALAILSMAIVSAAVLIISATHGR